MTKTFCDRCGKDEGVRSVHIDLDGVRFRQWKGSTDLAGFAAERLMKYVDRDDAFALNVDLCEECHVTRIGRIVRCMETRVEQSKEQPR